ncbi:MAG: hypothetical protein LBG84_05200 [Treponema sp.]|jgi:hypothetical protein|nr:hypothetical protein [Treponema sp.]
MTYYDGGYGFNWVGNVRYIGYFSSAKTSGVIIHEYTTRPSAANPTGDFRATYFKDLTATTAKMGTAANSSAPYDCEVSSLLEAKLKFASADAMGKYCATPGAYTKQ